MTTLITDRLTLTPMQESDFPDLKVLWSDPDFVRPIFPTPMNGEEVWTRLLRDIGHWQVRGHGNWSVRLTDGGAYVGSVGVLDYQREMEPRLDAPELGWAVATRFQGQGMAHEAVSAALAWCDEALDAQRTQCIINPANTPSLKLADRLGYRRLRDSLWRGEPITVLERLSA
ncbi:MAG: N-acetyltransferase [Brevundimonas sp.]|nr:MAG: N-acetyltransferase [Brevundimonas sp.]